MHIVLIAICSHSCNHGSCTSPNTCSCDEGWTGEVCNTGMQAKHTDDYNDRLLGAQPGYIQMTHHIQNKAKVAVRIAKQIGAHSYCAMTDAFAVLGGYPVISDSTLYGPCIVWVANKAIILVIWCTCTNWL